MGKMQRRKGYLGEYQVNKILNKYGMVSKRVSPLEAGGAEWGDLQVAGNMVGSVKVGKQVPKFIYDSKGDAEFLFIKRDRCKWIVCMDLEMFLEKFI
jgi:hypothetical protein